MAASHENEIQYFKSLSNWTNLDDIINFLEMYEWDVDFAAYAYLTNSAEGLRDIVIFNLDEINKNKPTQPNLRRMNSKEPRSTIHSSNENSTNQNEYLTNYSSLETSHSLHNLSNLQHTFDSNESVNILDKHTFNKQADQLFTSDDHVTTFTFSNSKQFSNDRKKLIENINSDIIGKDCPIHTPWGTRKLIYADYTASGRALTFIEHYILTNVLPYYANTHTENNASGFQTTKYREGSRRFIKRCLNAIDEDVLIFTGSGSTAAVNKLVNVLNLRDENVRRTHVVFVSTFEHHSNILPWKETGVEIVRIPNTKQGLLDQDALRQNLERYYKVKNIICTFNAASNVTGIRTDVDTISTLVHQYDGWIFWDYAASAPYVKIDMNPSKTAYKDAVFMSPHKFVGGPSTPGILVAKKILFKNKVPTDVGGGTVNFVTREETEYVQDIETREEGGTPNILGSIRAGLVFQLKESVGYDLIESREDELVEKFFQRFRNHPTLFILGSTTAKRIAIFSFLIYVPSFKKYLHHNFICSLLNDLFGIQVRSGCSCAGPYVLDLLNIDDQKAEIYTKFFTENVTKQLDEKDYIERNALMKPGFTRFNLSYFVGDEEVDYILNAVEFIANDGWKFLPLYTYNPETAVWRTRHMPSEHDSSQYHSIRMINYENGIMQEDFDNEHNGLFNPTIARALITTSSNDPIEQAKSMVKNLPKYVYNNIDFRTDPLLNIPDEYEEYIWFIIPKQIILEMISEYKQNNERDPKSQVPFQPNN